MQSISKAISGSMKKSIEGKLVSLFAPTYLDIINESYMHSVPKDSETHFKVIIVSDYFKGLSILEKHRKVQECLSEELKTGVHALSIVAKTQEEWEKNNTVTKSPTCLGGSKLDKKGE
mmetsp:Transcript_37190/g.43421  ORF Transcript_37190/g.43421 Transcript_37190/m.43421 type:complete len:118 (+) Transcript_37190:10-363(+)